MKSVKHFIILFFCILLLTSTGGCQPEQDIKNNDTHAKINSPKKPTTSNENNFNEPIPRLFNSIDELEPLNINQDELIKTLENAGYHEKNFDDITKAKLDNKHSKSFWITKDMNVNIGMIVENTEAQPSIRVVSIFFRNKEEFLKNKIIVEKIFNITSPEKTDGRITLEKLISDFGKINDQYIYKKIDTRTIGLIDNEGSYIFSVIKPKHPLKINQEK